MAQIRYSDKFNNTIKTSYKEPSKKFFQADDQDFERGGMIFHSHTSGTKHIGTPSNHLRPITIKNDLTMNSQINLNSLSEEELKTNISYSDCNNDRKRVNKLTDIITRLQEVQPQTDEITSKISDLEGHLENANDNLNSCINEFYTYYKNPDTNLKRIPSGNILPINYPPTDSEIFGDNLNSCRDSQDYHTPAVIKYNEKQTRPVYGTKRALDMVGVRVFDYPKNVNEQLPFNTDKSGYNVSNEPNTYNKQIVETFAIKPQNRVYSKLTPKQSEPKSSSNKYCDNFNCLNDVYSYKSKNSVYNGDCGSKSQLGTITHKMEKNPQVSEFVRNNIIGNNFENANRPSFFFRNKATFNNTDLIDDNELNLNSLKKVANTNYIEQTNKFRTEVNEQYFKQQTDKIKNNLMYRG